MSNATNSVMLSAASVGGKWTALPPLALRGIGTSNIESLQFYVHRLMWTTGIPFFLLARECGQNDIEKRTRASIYYQGHGLTDRAVALTYGVERLTGVEYLRCGTLWALSNIISAGSGLGRRWRRRWCPLCYEEWSASSYEPLIWEIELLGCCPIHSCRMESRCSSCGSQQGRSNQIERRLFCNRCGDFLGKGAVVPLRPSFAWWVDEQIGQLVEFCATPRAKPAVWSTYCKFVGSLKATAKRVGGSKGEIGVSLKGFDYGVRRHAYKPTVRTLVNLCALHGVSMREFLNAPSDATGPGLFDCWAGLNYLPVPSASQAQRVYLATRCMKDFIDLKPSYLPPVTLLLKRFQVKSVLVRDAIPLVFDRYQEKQKKQFSSPLSSGLARAYLFSLGILSSKGSKSDALLKSLAVKVSKYAEVDLKHAIRALRAANSVKATQSEARLQHYRTLLPRDRAIEWLLGVWHKNLGRI